MIVVPSLAPPRDVIVEVGSWRPGAVERSTRSAVVPGGKPLNVARGCARMASAVRLIALADADLAPDVRRLESSLIEVNVIVSTTRSRIDVCLTDGHGTTTVVNGAIAEPEPETLEAALGVVESVTEPGDILVLAGRQPQGATPAMLAIARRRGARLIVDTSGEDLIASLAASPDVAKMTATELGAVSRGAHRGEAWLKGRQLAPGPVELVVSDGERGLRAWLADGRVAEVRPPTVNVVNAFGAGDALTAGIASAADQDRSLLDGVVRGAAWAAACVEQLGTDFDPERARELEARIEVEVRADAQSSAATSATAGAR